MAIPPCGQCRQCKCLMSSITALKSYCWLEMFPSNAFHIESADLFSVGTPLLWQNSGLEFLKSKVWPSKELELRSQAGAEPLMRLHLLEAEQEEPKCLAKSSSAAACKGPGEAQHRFVERQGEGRAGLLPLVCCQTQEEMLLLAPDKLCPENFVGQCQVQTSASGTLTCTRLLAQGHQNAWVAHICLVLSRWAETSFLSCQAQGPLLGLQLELCSWQWPYRLHPRLKLCCAAWLLS